MTMTESGGSPIFMSGGDCFGNSNGIIWIVLIFALLFGNNRQNPMPQNLATTADLQRGFDTNEITRKLDGITNGLSDGFYAQNTNNLKSFYELNNSVMNEGRNIQSQMANCCCETNRNIDSVRFDMANYQAQIKADNVAQTQKVLDAIAQNKFDAMQNRINQLELNSALCGVVRYPNSMAYNAGSSPFCNCGSNYGYPIYS